MDQPPLGLRTALPDALSLPPPRLGCDRDIWLGRAVSRVVRYGTPPPASTNPGDVGGGVSFSSSSLTALSVAGIPFSLSRRIAAVTASLPIPDSAAGPIHTRISRPRRERAPRRGCQKVAPGKQRLSRAERTRGTTPAPNLAKLEPGHEDRDSGRGPDSNFATVHRRPTPSHAQPVMRTARSSTPYRTTRVLSLLLSLRKSPDYVVGQIIRDVDTCCYPHRRVSPHARVSPRLGMTGLQSSNSESITFRILASSSRRSLFRAPNRFPRNVLHDCA